MRRQRASEMPVASVTWILDPGRLRSRAGMLGRRTAASRLARAQWRGARFTDRRPPCLLVRDRRPAGLSHVLATPSGSCRSENAAECRVAARTWIVVHGRWSFDALEPDGPSRALPGV